MPSIRLVLIPCSSSSRRALQAAGIDTIQVDVWVTLIPPNGYLAPTLWDTVLAPNPRLAEQTAAYGVPMNITSLVSATNYLVRGIRRTGTCPVSLVTACNAAFACSLAATAALTLRIGS
jgi:hypothetical protein